MIKKNHNETKQYIYIFIHHIYNISIYNNYYNILKKKLFFKL